MFLFSVYTELRISVRTMTGTPAGPRRLSEVGRVTSRKLDAGLPILGRLTSRGLDAELSTFGCRGAPEFWMLTSRILAAGDLPSFGWTVGFLGRGKALLGRWDVRVGHPVSACHRSWPAGEGDRR